MPPLQLKRINISTSYLCCSFGVAAGAQVRGRQPHPDEFRVPASHVRLTTFGSAIIWIARFWELIICPSVLSTGKFTGCLGSGTNRSVYNLPTRGGLLGRRGLRPVLTKVTVPIALAGVFSGAAFSICGAPFFEINGQVRKPALPQPKPIIKAPTRSGDCWSTVFQPAS